MQWLRLNSYRDLIYPDCQILVLGGGAIGISVALILHSFGCRSINLAETNQRRRKTVQSTNICETYDPINESRTEAR